jgi:hypothetical protein
MFDIHQSIAVDGERDEKRQAALFDALLPAFAASAQGKACRSTATRLGSWAELFLVYYFDYLGCTVSDISVSDVREVVFELIPRKVSTEPESAPEIIEELRAFWQFLGAEYRLPQAAAIVAALGDDAVLKLRHRLADPRNFGMAKSFFAAGRAAGFDMNTEEGLQEFTAVYNAQIHARQGAGPAIPPGPLASLGPPDALHTFRALPLRSENRKDKRKKGKAERQARKRNRR